MKTKILTSTGPVFALLFVLGCGGGGGGGVGDACAVEGRSGECAAGAVCGKTETEELLCLKTCDQKEDCGAGFDCEGVEGAAVKGCRPKGGK